MIYLDNAATTNKKPERVAEAIAKALTSGEYGNPARGSHGFALNSFREIYSARETAAEFFGVPDPLKVAFTHNATDGLNRVIKGLFKPGDHVITTVTEHNSVLRPLYELQKEGLELSVAGLKDEILDEDSMEGMVRDNTRAIIVNMASNVTGTVADLQKIRKISEKNGLILIVDGSQAAGQRKINLIDMGIDVLVTTGHKSLYGPGGTGMILVGKDLSFRPVFSGGSGFNSFSHEHPSDLPDVFESGTLNLAGIMGLKAGMEYIKEKGIGETEKYIENLTLRFLSGLKSISGIKIYGTGRKDRTGCVSINIGSMSSSETAGILDEEYGIAVRPGAHCAPLMHDALGTHDQGTVRFSFSGFNEESDIDAALNALEEINNNYRGD